MRALNERQRRFVLEYCFGPLGYGSKVRAAKASGYEGADASIKVAAHRTLHNEKVQAALREVGGKLVRAEAKLRNTVAIANNLQHKDSLKANLAILDRGGFAVETTHSVVVAQERHLTISDPDKVMERIAQLAAAVGVRALPPPVTIDADVVDGSDDA